MSLTKTLQESMGQIPDCVAAGYVDMSTGLLLAVHTVGGHPHDILELLAAATADLFQGSSTVSIEQMWKKIRGGAMDNKHYFQEIIVLSDNLQHVFLRSKKYPDHALVYITRKSANIGMVISKSRMMLDVVTTAV